MSNEPVVGGLYCGAAATTDTRKYFFICGIEETKLVPGDGVPRHTQEEERWVISYLDADKVKQLTMGKQTWKQIMKRVL